ncbi:MAG: prolipoprotein diacylglyceryl transferase [Candidatus Kerfeldbacteria bacterium]
MFLHTFLPNPILAHFGRLTIHWYGLFLALGALAGYIVFIKLGRRYGFKTIELENLFIVTILVGLIGARLYHVFNEWSYYTQHPREILSIWNGGLAIHGALIAGIIVIILFARMKKRSFWLIADIAAPAVVIGQAIGRWGNYFNQELFGKPTNLPWGIPIDQLNRPFEYFNNTYFHPTFFYEFIGSLIVFGLLLFLHRRRLTASQKDSNAIAKTAGIIAVVYLITESLVRMGTESLRIDRVPLIAGIRLPLLVSALIAITAAAILFFRLRKRR